MHQVKLLDCVGKVYCDNLKQTYPMMQISQFYQAQLLGLNNWELLWTVRAIFLRDKSQEILWMIAWSLIKQMTMKVKAVKTHKGSLYMLKSQIPTEEEEATLSSQPTLAFLKNWNLSDFQPKPKASCAKNLKKPKKRKLWTRLKW